MTKRTVDQHAVLNRGWEHADELAHALRSAVESMSGGVRYGCLCPWDDDGNPMGEHGPLCGKSLHEEAIAVARATLRRYEEAREA